MVEFAARGQYHFTSSEFRSALGVSAAAAKQALWRLGKRGVIASPGRGFYVVVPPELPRARVPATGPVRSGTHG